MAPVADVTLASTALKQHQLAMVPKESSAPNKDKKAKPSGQKRDEAHARRQQPEISYEELKSARQAAFKAGAFNVLTEAHSKGLTPEGIQAARVSAWNNGYTYGHYAGKEAAWTEGKAYYSPPRNYGWTTLLFQSP